MAIHIKNMKELNKELEPIMISMTGKMADRVYGTLNYFLQEYYNSYDPVYYHRLHDFLYSAVKVEPRIVGNKIVASVYIDTDSMDELFDTLNCSFNVNRPVDTESAMKEMLWQRNMGAISNQTIIENSKHTSNTALELERLKAEEDDRVRRLQKSDDLQEKKSGDNNPSGENGESRNVC